MKRKSSFEPDLDAFWEEVSNTVPKSDIDHWNSDLYLHSTPQTDSIVSRYLVSGYGERYGFSMFVSGGGVWYDIPFAYRPYWEGKMGSRKCAWETESAVFDRILNSIERDIVVRDATIYPVYDGELSDADNERFESGIQFDEFKRDMRLQDNEAWGFPYGYCEFTWDYQVDDIMNVSLDVAYTLEEGRIYISGEPRIQISMFHLRGEMGSFRFDEDNFVRVLKGYDAYRTEALFNGKAVIDAFVESGLASDVAFGIAERLNYIETMGL